MSEHNFSSLKGLIDKPPIGGKEILPLSTTALNGFRLHPGAVPEPYRIYTAGNQDNRKQKKKHKRALGEGEKEDAEIEKKVKKQRREEEKDKKKKKKKEKKKKRNSPPAQQGPVF